MQKYKLINNYQVMENKIWVQREISENVSSGSKCNFSVDL